MALLGACSRLRVQRRRRLLLTFEANAESTFETARLEGLDVGEFLGGTDDLAAGPVRRMLASSSSWRLRHGLPCVPPMSQAEELAALAAVRPLSRW